MTLLAVRLINMLIISSVFVIYIQSVNAATYEVIDLCVVNPDTPGCSAAAPDSPPEVPPVAADSPSGDPSMVGGLFENAGAGLAGFLRAVTDPLTGFVVVIGITAAVLVIVVAVFGAFPEVVRSSVRQAYQWVFSVLRPS